MRRYASYGGMMERKITKMNGPVQEIIDEAARRIVTELHPIKIILFGSAARGNMGQIATLIFLLSCRTAYIGDQCAESRQNSIWSWNAEGYVRRMARANWRGLDGFLIFNHGDDPGNSREICLATVWVSNMLLTKASSETSVWRRWKMPSAAKAKPLKTTRQTNMARVVWFLASRQQSDRFTFSAAIQANRLPRSSPYMSQIRACGSIFGSEGEMKGN